MSGLQIISLNITYKAINHHTNLLTFIQPLLLFSNCDFSPGAATGTIQTFSETQGFR